MLPTPQRKHSNRDGFTMMELIIVMAVLAIAAALVIPNIAPISEDAAEQATRTSLERVRDAIVGPNGYTAHMKYVDSALFRDTPLAHGTGLPWPDTTLREDHPQLHYLFFPPFDTIDDEPLHDPITRMGWNGPYLEPSATTAYEVKNTPIDGKNPRFSTRYGRGRQQGYDGDRAPMDGWGRPIVIQLPDVSPGVITEDERLHVRLVSAGVNGCIDLPLDSLDGMPEAIRGDDEILFLYIGDPLDSWEDPL